MIKNILVVRNDRFGEFLLNIPAFRALKAVYPVSLLTLAVSPAVKELAECVEYADRVVIWDNNFRKQLKKHRFDLCVILNPAKEAHWAVFRAGIPKRVGYDRKWGFLLTRRLKDTKSLGDRHEVDANLELVKLAGAQTGDKSVSLGKLPDKGNAAYAGAVAVHPFTSDPVKEWPVKRFKELAQRIAREQKLKVILVGARENSAEFNDLGENVINLINKTSLVELAQVLKECKLLVTCDSGPMHLAAAVGTQVIALFRNDLAGKTARRWGPWGRGHIVIESKSLSDIGVDYVINKIKGVINE